MAHFGDYNQSQQFHTTHPQSIHTASNQRPLFQSSGAAPHPQMRSAPRPRPVLEIPVPTTRPQQPVPYSTYHQPVPPLQSWHTQQHQPQFRSGQSVQLQHIPPARHDHVHGSHCLRNQPQASPRLTVGAEDITKVAEAVTELLLPKLQSRPLDVTATCEQMLDETKSLHSEMKTLFQRVIQHCQYGSVRADCAPMSQPAQSYQGLPENLHQHSASSTVCDESLMTPRGDSGDYVTISSQPDTHHASIFDVSANNELMADSPDPPSSVTIFTGSENDLGPLEIPRVSQKPYKRILDSIAADDVPSETPRRSTRHKIQVRRLINGDT